MKILAIFSETRFNVAVPIIEENNLSEIFICEKYTTFDDIGCIFEKYKNSVEALLFSGSMPARHFSTKFPEEHIPVFHFAHNSFMTALNLIRHSVDYPNIPLSQTFCDNISNLSQYDVFKEVLGNDLMPKTFSFYNFSDTMYTEMSEYVLSLYKNGEVKMGYFAISSLYEQVAKKGYPCKLIPVRNEDILATLFKVRDEMLKNKATGNQILLATIDYSWNEKLSFSQMEYREATLTKILVDYKLKYNQSNWSINKTQNRLEIHIPIYSQRGLYTDFMPCFNYIKDNFEHLITVGIGLSSDIRSARDSSLLALQYAFDYGGYCAFGKEDNNLTGPVGEEQSLLINIDLIPLSQNFAKTLGIEPINYVRTMILLGSEKAIITSELLAKYLNVTTRAASRIISIILEKDIIKEMKTEMLPKKGRPIKYYQLKSSLKII